MGFLRRLLGASVDAPDGGAPLGQTSPGARQPDRAEGPTADDPASSSAPLPRDEVERERLLAREFDRGLSDLARRQLRFAGHAWTPPSQRRRDGDWILMESWKVQSPGGKDVTLKAGARLTFVGPGTLSPGGILFRTAKGVLVELPAGRETDDGWPDDLQRPRSATAGAEE